MLFCWRGLPEHDTDWSLQAYTTYLTFHTNTLLMQIYPVSSQNQFGVLSGLARLLMPIALLFLAWTVFSPSLIKCGTGIMVWSFVGTVTGRARSKSPIVCGAVGGAAAVVAFIVGFWALHLLGYFFHGGAGDYFEDGFVSEAFVYPVIYFLVYGPIAAGMGAVVGSIAWVVERTWTNRSTC